MTSPSSLSSLQSSDHVAITSPYFAPSSYPQRNPPPLRAPFPHSCSILSCPLTTTAPPIPPPFLPLATLCFSSSAAGTAFTDKSPVWLCRRHRKRLEEYRQREVSHSEQSLTAWNDMDSHSFPLTQGAVEGCALLPPSHSSQPSSFSSPSYSTFPSATAGSTAYSPQEDFDDGKPALSCPVRFALAGGWLCAVSFLALWSGYTLLNLFYHIKR